LTIVDTALWASQIIKKQSGLWQEFVNEFDAVFAMETNRLSNLSPAASEIVNRAATSRRAFLCAKP
jgi:hypothetical protein